MPVEPTLTLLQKDTALHDSPIAPSFDADLKLSPSKAEQLENLRVSDDELVGSLTYQQLTLYEKKSVLINREMDIMNRASFWKLGRYQLCGFGYFLDLCWAQAFGLVSGALQQELGVPNNRIGDLSTAFSAGMTVGALFWGLAVDIIGRRWAFNMTCLISSVFGLLFASPNNFGALCFFASMIGLGVGGNIPIDATITLEFLPTNRRFLLCALSTFQPLGVVVASLVSWGLVPRYSCDTSYKACSFPERPCCTKSSNMGWRYTIFVLGCITLGIFFLRFVLFTFHESPKFLLAKGKDEEAIDVLYKIAAFNRQPQPNLTIDDFRLLDKEYAERESITSDEPLSSGPRQFTTGEMAKIRVKQAVGQFAYLKGFFATKRMIWVSVTLWIAYMSLFWSFSIAGGYLPLILRQKGIDTSAGLNETYRNYVVVYLPGVTATILGSFLMEIPKVGRKWAMAFAAALMGTSLFLFATISSFAAFTGMNLLEYWAQSLYAALLYAFTPEVFPAPFRGSGSGIASTLGRLSSTVAPIAAGSFFSPKSPSVLFMAGGAAFVSMLAILALPFDTRGRHTF
ncbi:MFS transporter, sugar transporter [Rhodotorula toruloides]|uniref:MFS transporter, sugar transporter n=1 Tax=Rhodotorula toruloides TaxID=5286 RepID=A0A511KN48_RHOTO|nr:MFS transporter, sugar transporter [Rhodotorula toruloides]